MASRINFLLLSFLFVAVSSKHFLIETFAFNQALIEKVEKGNLLTTLPTFGPDYFLSMEISIKKHTSEPRGIFTLVNREACPQLKKKNWNKCVIATAYMTKSKELGIIMFDNGESKDYIEKQKVSLNTPMEVKIKQKSTKDGMWRAELFINGKLVKKIPIESSKVYKDVEVYATNPWYDGIHGTIENLSI